MRLWSGPDEDSLEGLHTYVAEAALVLGFLGVPGVLGLPGVCGRPAGRLPGPRLGGLEGDSLLLEPADHQPVPEEPEQEQQAENLEDRSPRHLAGVRGQQGPRTSPSGPKPGPGLVGPRPSGSYTRTRTGRSTSLWVLHQDQDANSSETRGG